MEKHFVNIGGNLYNLNLISEVYPKEHAFYINTLRVKIETPEAWNIFMKLIESRCI